MRFEQFIAKRFLPKDRSNFSGPLVNIATYSITLGVIVMIMAVCILRGFQQEITNKVVGFGSHIVITNYEVGNAYNTIPLSTNRPEVENIRLTPNVHHVQFFAEKGGMLKTDDQIHGILLKGVSHNFDTAFFASNLVEGRLFNLADTVATNEVIISQTIANKLHIALGDKLRAYFWQDDGYRARAFTAVGIYRTDLSSFDEHYLVGDIRQVQRLNGWQSDQVDGYEVIVDNFNYLDHTANSLAQTLPYEMQIATIVENNPSLFSWLNLLNSNIVLIMAIMAMVCAVSIISALLIMIFEKTSTIGVLKTLGANNRSIRNIFLLKSATIIGRGILLGNAVAWVCCWVQQHYHLIHLDSDSYAMNFVPIDLNLWTFVIISVGSMAICLAALLIPSTYITRIDPAKTIKVE